MCTGNTGSMLNGSWEEANIEVIYSATGAPFFGVGLVTWMSVHQKDRVNFPWHDEELGPVVGIIHNMPIGFNHVFDISHPYSQEQGPSSDLRVYRIADCVVLDESYPDPVTGLCTVTFRGNRLVHGQEDSVRVIHYIEDSGDVGDTDFLDNVSSTSYSCSVLYNKSHGQNDVRQRPISIWATRTSFFHNRKTGEVGGILELSEHLYKKLLSPQLPDYFDIEFDHVLGVRGFYYKGLYGCSVTPGMVTSNGRVRIPFIAKSAGVLGFNPEHTSLKRDRWGRHDQPKSTEWSFQCQNHA